MKKTILSVVSTMVTIILGLGLSTTNAQNKSLSETKKLVKMENRQKVVELLKSIETGASEPVAYINPNKYIQHNLAVGDGLAGFGAVLQALPKGSAKANTYRAFQDGDFVFAHTEYNFFGPKIGFDIFRFEDGKIVLGTADIKDLDKTQANKTLVGNFVDDILVNGKMEKLQSYFSGDNYQQHNPSIGDGLSGLGKALGEWAKQGITMKYDKVHKVLGEGNFVLVVSEGHLAGKHNSFYDLFRVENGKIAEHWDTIEEVPAKESWKNNNGKF
jgi:predicted SnoaL-like aldol condensation-catalyzing enzyme